MTRNVLITGGAGFIGSNLARHLLEQGARVHLYDNLARPGVEHNLRMLKQLDGDLTFTRGDVRDRDRLASIVRDADEIYHFAAQVAVTTSIDDPRDDFETNLLGTFNVLEAARLSHRRPFLLYTSTNKVYGDLGDIALRETTASWQFSDRRAIDESHTLDFHSPYGCSKGAAEQYVRDYARIYDIPTVVFRMSCIAGPQQFGNEDQGWLAHFLYSALNDRPLTIYGDGKQVRDILHVHDLVAAISAACAARQNVAGEIFNIGGGPQNAASLIEVLDLITQITGRKVRTSFAPARLGDQRIFVADTSKFTNATGWKPHASLKQTMTDILSWRKENDALFAEPVVAAGNTAR